MYGGERRGSTHKMCANLTGHIYLIDSRESVIQFLPARFEPTLYRAATGWDFTVFRWDPFHLGGDGQELVPPVMADFGATIRNAAWGEKRKIDLARMDGVVKDGGTNEHFVVNGWSDQICRRERDAEPGWRGGKVATNGPSTGGSTRRAEVFVWRHRHGSVWRKRVGRVAVDIPSHQAVTSYIPGMSPSLLMSDCPNTYHLWTENEATIHRDRLGHAVNTCRILTYETELRLDLENYTNEYRSNAVSRFVVATTVQTLEYGAPASSTCRIYFQHLVHHAFRLDKPQRIVYGLLLTESCIR